MSSSTALLPMRARTLPTAALNTLRAIYQSLSDPSTPLLPYIPKPVKILFLILLLINSPSFPFTWHFRVWWTPIKAYFDVYTKGRQRYLRDWKRANDAGGGIRIKSRLKRLAWVDDCDYNSHLSNSAYAKSLDAARMQWCVEAMSPLFTPGVHMALGASHYVFFKEIPMGMEYVMESRCGGWGDKWIYLVTEFVIYPKRSRPSTSSGKAVEKAKEIVTSAPAETANTVIPNISAPPSGTDTPDRPSGTSSPNKLAEAKVSALRSRAPREDGGVVCCLAMSEYCFKIGRVTVPPRIALHLALHSPSEEGREHATNLIMNTKDRGRRWIRGEWKDGPDADTLGSDIGLGESANGHADGEADGKWIARGRDAMDKVVEGLGAF